jgi:hypothetical protein
VIAYDGSTLTLLPSPDASETLTSVTAFDPASVYVVGVTGQVYRWDGTAWETLAGPFPHSLTAITGVATDDLWAAGSAGLIEHWHEP